MGMALRQMPQESRETFHGVPEGDPRDRAPVPNSGRIAGRAGRLASATPEIRDRYDQSHPDQDESRKPPDRHACAADWSFP